VNVKEIRLLVLIHNELFLLPNCSKFLSLKQFCSMFRMKCKEGMSTFKIVQSFKYVLFSARGLSSIIDISRHDADTIEKVT